MATNYPGSIDTFPLLTDGRGEENRVRAEYFNQVQDALTAIQTQVLQSAESYGSSGSVIWTHQQTFTVQEDQAEPGQRMAFRINLSPEIAERYFDGTPLTEVYGLLAYCTAYGRRNGSVTYFPCRAGVNVLSDVNNSRALNVVVVRSQRWLQGDKATITLLVLRP